MQTYLNICLLLRKRTSLPDAVLFEHVSAIPVCCDVTHPIISLDEDVFKPFWPRFDIKSPIKRMQLINKRIIYEQSMFIFRVV